MYFYITKALNLIDGFYVFLTGEGVCCSSRSLAGDSSPAETSCVCCAKAEASGVSESAG